MCLRDAILEAGRRPVVRVDAPGLGPAVFVRCLSGREAIAATAGRSGQELSYAIGAASLCDEQGERLSPPVTAEDLLDLAAGAVTPLIHAALRENRATAEAVEDAKKA